MLEEDIRGPGMETTQGNKTGQIYASLKSLIVLQKLPPRTPLEMKMIADKFRVSITPVREALILLANEGIIAKDASRTYITRALNARDVAADYESGFMIAKFNIERNVGAFSSQGLRLLSLKPAGHESLETAASTYALAIEALYERIAGLTGNARLVRLMQEFNDRTNFIRQLGLQDEHRLQATGSSMQAFVERLERGDVAGAVDNLEAQLSQKLEIMSDLVREGNLRALEAIDFFNER